jgi:hypothetical protein
MRKGLITRQISMSQTPAGLHEKKAERFIQTIKRRNAATLANLTYVLPSSLEAEAYLSTIRHSNSLPTTNTLLTTPYCAFTHTKPFIPEYAFGTLGMFYHPRADDDSLRAEIVIFLSHGYHKRYLKAYLPTRLRVYSMRRFTPLKHQYTPVAWNFKQNDRNPTLAVPSNPSNDPNLPTSAPVETVSSPPPKTMDILDTNDTPSTVPSTPQSTSTPKNSFTNIYKPNPVQAPFNNLLPNLTLKPFPTRYGNRSAFTQISVGARTLCAL